MSQIGIWSITPDGPVLAQRARIGFERSLEDWIERDPGMLPDDLTIVGRQITLGEHRLDLLAISRTGQWVIIELKEGSLYRETLMQVLDYTAKIAALPAEDLLRRLNRGGEQARQQASELLAGEAEGAGGRDVVAMVVGTTVDPGLERLVSFLGSYTVPIRVVTFDVFEGVDGGRMLVREIEDPPESAEVRAQSAYSVAAVRERAAAMGDEALLDAFIEAGRDLGLHVRPWKLSVTLNPPERKAQTYFYAKPEPGGKLWVGYSAPRLAETGRFAQEDVERTVGRFPNWAEYGPEMLREFLQAMDELFRRGD